jgi:ABC-type glycerol-3-phosphate transport system substrate-binding protein
MMASIVLLAAGCSDKDKMSSEKGTKEQETVLDSQTGMENTNSDNAKSDAVTSNAKGRYLEEDLVLPEYVSDVYDFKLLADGSIGILDQTGLYCSTDNGQTFTLKDSSLDSLSNGGESYVRMAALGSDGSVFAQVIGSKAEQSDPIPEYYYIQSDGTINQLATQDGAMGNQVMSSCTILEDGTILTAFGESIYELPIDTGNFKVRFENAGVIRQVREIGDYIYIMGDDTLKCYQTDRGVEADDEMLSDLKAYLPQGSSSEDGERVFPILMCQGDTKDSIILATSKGLYRHVKGGSIFEELMLGELSSLSDPSLEKQGLLQLLDGTFLVAYRTNQGVSLKHYVYDNKAPTIPQNRLTVYSLYENIDLRQAIVAYRKKDLNTYIEYMVGMTGNDGITREDAIRNLNTAVLSNEGPDVLMMDGLPIDSYMEKGILADLSELFNNQLKGEEFFENIRQVYAKNEKIFAVPTRFTFPVLAGKKEFVDSITDLDSFTVALTKYREEHKTENLLSAYTPEGVLRKLYSSNVPAWLDEDGKIKKEALTQFLEQAKEIYDLEKVGSTKANVEEIQLVMERKGSGISEQGGEPYLKLGLMMDPYLNKESAMMVCDIASMNDYSTIIALVDSQEGHQLKGLTGQSKGVFSTNIVLGINTQSDNQDLAQEFVASMLSPETQSYDSAFGFPLNKGVWQASTKDTTTDGIVNSMSYHLENGEIFDFDIKWPSEEQINGLANMIENLKIPTISDVNLKNTILELAPAAISGEQDAEGVTNEITNKMQIYLAE